METPLILYLLAGTIVLLLLRPIFNTLKSPLRGVPGPWLARYTRFWYFYRVKDGDFHHENIALHRDYGSAIVRYGPDRYSISDPSALKQIYGLGQGFPKSDWYASFSATAARSMFTVQDQDLHRSMRRRFQATYSMSSMVTYEAFVDKCTTLFRERLTEKAQAKEVVDMAWWFERYATDTVAMISSSKRLGNLDAGEDVGNLGKILHGGLSYASLMGIFAEWHLPFMELMARLKSIGLARGTPRMIINDFVSGSMGERRRLRADGEKIEAGINEDETSPKDMLDKFLDYNEKDPQHFTNYDISVGLSSNVVAGADTTAASLSAVLYYLLKSPATFQKLRNEIDQGVASGTLSSPVTFKQAQELPYLQAVLQESLRMHPAVGLPLERVVPSGGADICGQFFPKGTIVGVNAWVLHYDTSVFGSDAAEFRPRKVAGVR